MSGKPDGRLVLALKLDHLLKLRATLNADSKPSYKTMAAEISSLSGESFSGAYLWQLHQGERTNPTLRHLRSLARYFDVPVSYFMEDEVARDVIEEDLARRELDRAMAEAGVTAVYLRGDLTALSPEGKRMAADMIRRLRELEQGVEGNLTAGAHVKRHGDSSSP